MDQMKTDGKKKAIKKNFSARLERRKKWWAEKKGNTRVTRASTSSDEKTPKSEDTAESATSSRGFTSTHSPSFTSVKSKNERKRNNNSGSKNSSKGAKNLKLSKVTAEKDKSLHKNDKMKLKNESTPEKAPLPEVAIGRNFNTAEGEMAPSVHSPKKYVLFVGNLPYSVTKEQVEEHFKKTGGVKAVRIPREKGTEKGKGFAYIEFNSHISHRIALRLHNTTLGGRKINVEFTSAGGKNEMRLQKLRAKNERLCKFKMPFDT